MGASTTHKMGGRKCPQEHREADLPLPMQWPWDTNHAYSKNAYSGRRLFRLEGGQGQAQVVAQTAGRSLLLCRNNDSYAAAPSQPCSFVRSYSSVFFLSKTVLGITRLKTRLKSLCLQCKFYCRQTPVRVKTCFSVSWGVAQMFRPCQSLLRWISPRSVHLKGTS